MTCGRRASTLPTEEVTFLPGCDEATGIVCTKKTPSQRALGCLASGKDRARLVHYCMMYDANQLPSHAKPSSIGEVV
jgi:hypothetical protein